jgi:hypothetical protein
MLSALTELKLSSNEITRIEGIDKVTHLHAVGICRENKRRDVLASMITRTITIPLSCLQNDAVSELIALVRWRPCVPAARESAGARLVVQSPAHHRVSRVPHGFATFGPGLQ